KTKLTTSTFDRDQTKLQELCGQTIQQYFQGILQSAADNKTLLSASESSEIGVTADFPSTSIWLISVLPQHAAQTRTWIGATKQGLLANWNSILSTLPLSGSARESLQQAIFQFLLHGPLKTLFHNQARHQDSYELYLQFKSNELISNDLNPSSFIRF